VTFPFSVTRVVLQGLLLAVVVVTIVPSVSVAAGTTIVAPSTASYYESNADPGTLMSQGESAGDASAQGLVILDFGRPATEGSLPGTMDFDAAFVSLSSIVSATVSYAEGYLETAPPALSLHVAIGTNDSCGTAQPCGNFVCGCVNEPPSYQTWGAQLAASVEEVQSQVNALKEQAGDTDVVTIVAGDDAEPAFDPGYENTYDLLAGYASAVGGFQPAMIDYGSAEPGYWSMNQLLQVVDGFRPDIAVPEVYTDAEATSWGSLFDFASTHGHTIHAFGVLTSSSTGDSPTAGYDALLNAVQPVTGQSTIGWSSAMTQ
jgi:hypothetical protein